MPRLTPTEILRLSEPIELVYQQVVDALLVNIAKHFNTGKALSTQDWQLKKLAEIGQLNRESLQIISSMTGQVPELMQAALENAALKAVKDMEPDVRERAEDGILTGESPRTVVTSQSIRQSLESYAAQAVDKFNLVNTTMLQSTLEQYRKVIINTANIERQMQAAQGILNEAAGKVVTGTFSRTQALRDALSKLSDEGITGFYDKAGRKWSPEAYTSMDVRTTVHNTALEARKAAALESGRHIFQVTRHNGARPLCYPYQGKFYSWKNESGTFFDGEGKRHSYAPISSTSYGKPAGLFGVNCGHDWDPIEEGVYIPRERTKQDKEENDRVYQESQEQRRLEREVRYAKRKAVLLDKAGDKEGFEAAAAKIKQRQDAYNSFCGETGRTKRTDRTQVYEYNRSISSKVTQVNRKIQKQTGQ